MQVWVRNEHRNRNAIPALHQKIRAASDQILHYEQQAYCRAAMARAQKPVDLQKKREFFDFQGRLMNRKETRVNIDPIHANAATGSPCSVCQQMAAGDERAAPTRMKVGLVILIPKAMVMLNATERTWADCLGRFSTRNRMTR